MIRYIYTFFTGLFLAIFIGMGIAVFYPEPVPPAEPSWYRMNVGKEGPNDVQKREEEAFIAKQKDFERAQWHHNKYVSIIVLICAVAILVIALSLSEKLGIIADGVLLGGIFSLLYGIGRGMATDSNKYRFLVASVGLAVTLILGYFKFTRQQVKKSEGNAMLKLLIGLVAIIAAAALVLGTYTWQQRKINTLNKRNVQLQSELASSRNNNTVPEQANPVSYTSNKGVAIKVYTPIKNEQVVSPFIVVGEVPGNWSFEASFPVKLLDAKGALITEAPAQLIGDWMTEKPVAFSVTLTFPASVKGSATLQLQKDNPSGLETNNDSVSIPVILK